MQAQIVVCKESGERHLYLPQENRFLSLSVRAQEIFVNVYFADYPFVYPDGTMTTVFKIYRQSYCFTSKLDVPIDLVGPLLFEVGTNAQEMRELIQKRQEAARQLLALIQKTGGLM